MRDEASAALGAFQKQAGAAAKNVLDSWKQVTVAGVALGGGLEALARKQAPLIEANRKLEIQTGLTQKEIRGMATELSNATTPLNEALALMEQGAKQGLESAAALKEYTKFWDMVGDATGLNAAELAKAGAALKAVGISAGDEGKLLGAFGLITTQTSGNVQEFLSFIGRLAPEMNQMGISVNDAAVIMTAMEKEMGLTARAAQTQFRKAINDVGGEVQEVAKKLANMQASQANLDKQYQQGLIPLALYTDSTKVNDEAIARYQQTLKGAEGGLGGVLKALGLTEEQVAKYTAKLRESQSVMEKGAEANASTMTMLQRLQSGFGDVVFQMGPFIQQAAQIAPLLLVIGPAMGALSAAKGIYAVVTSIATAATTAFGVALKVALGPVGLIVLAITGLIAVGVLLWKNWDEVSAKAKEIWDAITAFFTTTWETIKGIFTDNWRAILGVLFPPVGIALMVAENWGAVVEVVVGIWDRIKDTFKEGVNFVIGLAEGMANAWVRAVNAIIGALNSIRVSIPDWVPGIGGRSFGINLPRVPEVSLPRLAEGGIVRRPTLALLGERGPEAVVPLARGGGMAGAIIIQGPVVSVAGNLLGTDVEELVHQAMIEIARRTGLRLGFA
jgi:hypothetical protein